MSANGGSSTGNHNGDHNDETNCLIIIEIHKLKSGMTKKVENFKPIIWIVLGIPNAF